MQITVTNRQTRDAEPPKKWKLTKWTAADGIVWSTFDAKARPVNIGDVVEIPAWETDDYDERKFEKGWSVVSQATPDETAKATAAAASTGAESDSQKRLSIERQSTTASFLDFCGRVVAAGLALSPLQQSGLDKAFQWGISRFDETPKTSEQEWAKLQSAGTPKDMGELLTWCQEQGISRAKFMEIGEIDEAGMKQVNVDEACQVIKDYLHEHKGG